jgi:hypothetical protein
MASTSEVLSKLLKKAGIEFNEEINGELPDEIATQLDNSLLTIKAATNNHPDVKKVYFAQAYNGLDAELKQILEELPFDDTVKTELLSEPSSTKRTVNLIKKLKEVQLKKDNTDDPGKSSKLQEQINELHAKLKAEADAKKDLQSKYEKQIKDIHIQSKVSGLLSQYKTVYDELPAEAKEAAINALLTKSLQDSDAEFTFDEKGNLSLVKKDGTNLFGDNHTQLTPQSFIDKALSKILQVTNTNSGGNNNSAAPKNVQNTNANAALSAAIAEASKSYEAASKSPVLG